MQQVNRNPDKSTFYGDLIFNYSMSLAQNFFWNLIIMHSCIVIDIKLVPVLNHCIHYVQCCTELL